MNPPPQIYAMNPLEISLSKIGRWKSPPNAADATAASEWRQMEDGRRILEATQAILLQAETLLHVLSQEVYTQKVPIVFNASIGGHIRHCLDHFTSLLRGMEQGLIDYDHRDREVRIESEPQFASDISRSIQLTLQSLKPERLADRVTARCEVSYTQGDSPQVRSTLGRELVYAVAHAIHHFALIRVMAHLLGITLPPQFGLAPSTLAHLERSAKAC